MHPSVSTIAGAMLLAPFLVNGGTAYALDWKINAGVTTGVSHNTNARLTSSNEESVQELTVTPDYRMTGASETLELAFDAAVNISRNYGIDDRDAESPSLGFSANKQLERGSFGINTGLSRAQTSTTELEDTGRINVEGIRTSYNITPSGTFRVNDLNTLSGSAGLNDTSYDISSLVGTRSYSWNGSWARTTGELKSINLSISGQYIRPDARGSATTDTYNARLGREWQLTESISFSTLSGLRYLFTDGKGNGLGTALEAEVSYAGELTSMDLKFAQNVRSSGSGQTVEDNILTFNLNRPLSEFVSFTFTASAQQTSTAADDNNTGSDRDVLSISPSISWQIGEKTSLTGSLRYFQQTLSTSDPTSSGTAAIRLRYNLQ